MKKNVSAEKLQVGPYTVSLVRSGRRSVSLSVGRDGCPLVRAPYRMKEEEIARFVLRHAAWLERALDRHRRDAAVPEPDEEACALLRLRAKEMLPKRIAHYAALMGVSPTGFRVTSARTRFGSCSPKNSLSFSLYLMQWPDEAIDYVVVHELAHMIHKNHSPAFHREIERILPDHRARRALLKERPQNTADA